jgi:hypothetical protein
MVNLQRVESVGLEANIDNQILIHYHICLSHKETEVGLLNI